MRRLHWAHYAALGFFVVYSIVLLVIEAVARPTVTTNLYSDVYGRYPFFALHTTLCVALWWGVALTFAFCHLCAHLRGAERDTRWFYLSQVAVFAYLGIDDRFMAHEWIGKQLNMKDEWWLLGVGLIQVGLLFYFRRVWWSVPRAKAWIGLAVVVSALALGADAVTHQTMPFRWGLEDIPKAWAGLFYFLFTWELCLGEAQRLQQSPPVVHKRSRKRAAAV